MTIRTQGYIRVTRGFRAGKPRLAGHRITVADIVIMHLKMGMPLEEIAGKFALPLAALYAAMSYYYDHKKEIDRDMERDHAFAEALRKRSPSLLRARLQALKNG